CIRVSGKHNDLEETGHDTYHHTFFAMLGNWSFGDYYKKEAIEWAWELLTKVWGLPKDRLYATVFGGDDQVPADTEAEELLKTCTDINPDHIIHCDRKDNFWMMGDTGPCGPCSEVHIDLTPDASGGALVNKDSPLVIEIWNLVFIQFNAEADGSLRELPAKHVDTGMGFERACAVVECTDGGKRFDGVISNYDTEVFQPVIRTLCEMSGATYTPGQSSDEQSIALRVCADHIRMISFSIADGAIPSSDGRGYVVRRLLRRASRYGRQLGLQDPFLYKLVPVLAKQMGDIFPELLEHQTKLENIIKAEETSFNQTLDRGLTLFENEVKQLQADGQKVFPGAAAFKLYDTFGFPLDLTQAMARELSIQVDEPEFDRLMEEQRSRARAAQVKVVVSAEDKELELPPTPFTGYAESSGEATIQATITSKDSLAIVLDKTPFYAEKGGQLGDTGILKLNGDSFEVLDTRQQEGVVFHMVDPKAAGKLTEGAKLQVELDTARRKQIERHHTATHLLHWALREVLGTDVHQQGSLVAPDRLRFDFTHFQAVSPSDLATIERLANERILENGAISYFEIPYSQKPDSILAFFGDKYGDRVRVVKIGGRGTGELETPVFDGYSMELCGGTHTGATGELGFLTITTEGAIAAGVRRLEAVSGFPFLSRFRQEQDLLDSLSSILSCSRAELEKKAGALVEQQKQLEKQLRSAQQAKASNLAQELLDSQSQVQDIPLIVKAVGDSGPEQLRLLADGLKESFQGVAVLGAAKEGKVSLLVYAAPEVISKGLHAGKLIKELAKQVGGGGGGRADLAQAGGREPENLDSALKSAPELVQAQITS
ncbi:MAG: alanine--tRNA ligase, partial [Candidatus Eremiobacteraeota bacterium]|nr:alanine--tRNA ligase [Candidatus Eremiobacteraeota bacterium]